MKPKLPAILVLTLFALMMILNACSPQAEPTAAAPTDTSTPPVTNATPATPATPTASATNTAAPTALSAVVRELTGMVEVKRFAEDAFTPAQVNSLLDENGQAMTGSDGKTRLDLSTGTIVRVAPNSLFTLTSNQPAEGGLKTRLQLAIGQLFIILNGGSLEVETPTGTAAVRGSYMSVSYDSASGGVKVTCLEGRCSLSGANGSVDITAGQTAVIIGAGQPPIIGEMSDEDLQEWLEQCPEAQVLAAELLEQPAPPQPQLPAPGPVVIRKPPKQEPEEPVGPEQPQGPSLTPTVTISGITPANSVFGQPLSAAVYVTPSQGGPMPTGTVMVLANGGAICSASLDAEGSAFCSGGVFTLGTISLVAKYSGDDNYLTAKSSAWGGNTVTIAGTTTTITSQAPLTSEGSVGSAVFTATVDIAAPGAGTPYGYVTFSDGVDSCTANDAPWTCSIIFTTYGIRPVTATYVNDVDSNFMGSISAPVNHGVVVNADTEFLNANGPVSAIAVCNQPYTVEVLDLSGVNQVNLEYSVNDSTFLGPTSISMSKTGDFLWDVTTPIPAAATDMVYWRVVATDGALNQLFFGGGSPYFPGFTGLPVNAYSYSPGILCP